MLCDATIEVTCDGKGCRESLTIDLPFTYPDYSGKGGRYDHRPQAVDPKIEREGWTVVGENEHLCPDCAADAERRARPHRT